MWFVIAIAAVIYPVVALVKRVIKACNAEH